MATNGTLGKLTRKQRAFIVALATAPSVRDAASEAKISESSAWRWLRQDNVRAEIAKRQSDILAAVSAGIVSDMAEARAVLRSIMGDRTLGASVRARAATTVLDHGMRLFEVLTLGARIAGLEERMASEKHREQSQAP